MKRGNTSSGIVNMVRAALDAVSEYPSGLAPGQPSVTRVDGWTNVTTGLGTSRDKTQGGFFAAGCFLDDNQLRNLYTFDDLASKIVDTYPKEELRLGFGLSGLPSDVSEKVQRYLRPFCLPSIITDARIWGRLFGGSAIWPMLDDGLDPAEPLDLTRIKSVLGLRVLEKPWLVAHVGYPDGPKVGEPMLYRVQEPHAMGVPSTVGLIHESRLIRFPGERTDSATRAKLRAWDLSCLVKPYEALRSSGETWKAIELLVVDANQGVYKVKNLFAKIAGDPSQGEPTDENPSGGGSFLKRVKVMDRVKSVFRAIVLDLEEEDYERLTSTGFTGLSDISDRAWRRVASAADIPVPLLQGENPAGLNNSGTMQLQWFWSKTKQNQTQIDEPRILALLKIMLSAQDAPSIVADESDTESEADGEDVEPLDKIGIVWPDLWAPTAAELADIRLKTAQEANIWITAQAMLPEEALLSIPKEWWPAVDRAMREKSLEEDREMLLEHQHDVALGKVPDPNDPKAKLGEDPDEDPEPEKTEKKDWDEDQPRDENGMWSESGGSSGGSGKGSSVKAGRMPKAVKMVQALPRPSKEQGQKHADRLTAHEAAKPTGMRERAAIKAFSFGYDETIRATQRGATDAEIIAKREAQYGGPVDKRGESHAEHLRKAKLASADLERHIANSPKATDMPTVYRGIVASRETVESMLNADQFDMRGQTTSTTWNPQVAKSFVGRYQGEGKDSEYGVILKMNQKSGVGIEHLASDRVKIEREVLMSGTSKFKITGRYYDADNPTVLVIEGDEV